tara:strand:- start:3572 stop:3748 length:177 start_codon:yes stop_codon:yes gene_type:complete
MKKMSKNPDYVKSRISYNGKVATRCRICGGQLLDPIDAKNEYHKACLENYKRKSYRGS